MRKMFPRAFLFLLPMYICFSLLTIPGQTPPTLTHPQKVRVGVLTDNDPFSCRRPDGQVTGFAVDLLADIEHTMGLQLERILGTTNEINSAFASGRLDLVQSYAQMPERESHADFSVPYLTLAGSIFVRQDALAIKNLQDLRGMKVFVHPGSLGEQVLRANGLSESIVSVNSVEMAFRKLAAGEGDATLATRLTGLITVHNLGLRHVVPTGPPVEGYEVRYCFAVKEGDRVLLARINEGLAILQRTGKFTRIYNKWFGMIDPPGYSAFHIALAVSIGLGTAFLIALWALIRQRQLHRRITRQSEALALSEDRYRGVFEASPEGLAVLSPVDGSPADFLFLEINPSARHILNLPEPALGKSWWEMLPDDSLLCDRMTAALSGETSSVFEHQRLGKKAAWVRVSLSRIGRNVLISLTDLTEEKATAEQLHRTEEHLRLNQKMEAIGTLASGVAHDFNNILTGIVGNADLIRLTIPKEHPSSPMVDGILQSSERARVLIRQILAFARRTEVKQEPLLINPLVKEVLDFVRPILPASVEIRHLPASQLIAIVGDSSQLHQVLMNLITNAAEAMDNRPGTIEVKEDLVSFSRKQVITQFKLEPGEYLRLSVRDTGCGISPEILSRIFEPFFTTKSKEKGTGLGLSVVHGIVKNHNGAIQIESRPGEGTTIYLYFPLSTLPVTIRNGTGTVSYITGHGERVLFIDDEPSIVEMARIALTLIGYDVSAHCDPKEAMAEFDRDPSAVALVFTDLGMPQINGLEVAHHIRKCRPHCPIILASGFLSDEEVNRARTLHINHMIEKPLTLNKLSSIIAAHLADTSFPPPASDE